MIYSENKSVWIIVNYADKVASKWPASINKVAFVGNIR